MLCIFAALFSKKSVYTKYLFKINTYEKDLTFYCHALHGIGWAS